MKRYLAGIDTGGTYTDAVIIDPVNQRVVASAKALTTHGDLTRGVSDALTAVLGAAPTVTADDIKQVSLSTTLATNALVEGRGSSIAVFLIGFSPAMTERTELRSAIPDAQIVNLDGGHRHDGQECAPLDEESLALHCRELDVDAFAVAGHYSVRNPAHEQRASARIRELTGKPVSASYDLSDSLNGPRRALTAAFNARIISLIVELVSATSASLARLGINAPIMIVKGDGSVAAARTVMEKPIETILSGPAASVIGARYLTGLDDFVLADMGGTTTDVATVVGGWPTLSPRGANVGGFQTLVHAIDLHTAGLGGDSGVTLDESGRIILDTARALPLSMLAALYPDIEKELEAALTTRTGMASALHYLVVSGGDPSDKTHCPDAFADTRRAAATLKERRFLATLRTDRPNRESEVVNGASDRGCVTSLIQRGLLRRSGFTPSDAAHVTGAQHQWSTQAARTAAELLGRAGNRIKGNNVDDELLRFCRHVIDRVVEKSTYQILGKLSGHNATASDKLMRVAASGERSMKHLKVSVSSSLPLVAVGGPAHVFYPAIGNRLGTKTHVPQHSEVANAVGAAVGLIRAECSVEVTLNETGAYLIHTQSELLVEPDATVALNVAERAAKEAVRARLSANGSATTQIHVDVSRIQLPGITDDNGLVGATVRACGDGLPTQT